ncbi:NUDIX hydrolase [Glycomyces endophyticus]|uniref:NUDIX hydrolase n=1 Tax=Glycomyces endophyticus TaxID=480996 RepID=A0ABP4T333_9ACTN
MARVTTADTSAADRTRLTDLLDGVVPWDDLERDHLDAARAWISGGAPLYRTAKPATPPMHLVSYFAAFDEARERVLLVEHRKAGLRLPTGGHVEPGESPWDAVRRECREELGIAADPSGVAGERPFFVTVTDTLGQGRHTDVSLWHLIRATPEDVTWFSEEEFSGVAWLSLAQVLAEPIATLDPHMHRFTAKLARALTG